MRSRISRGIVLLVVTVLAGAAASGAEGGIKTFTACGKGSPSDKSCIIGNAYGLAYDGPSKRVHYRLCVNPPRSGTRCWRYDTNARGYDWVYLFSKYERIGSYVIRWKKNGRQIDRDNFYVGIGD